MRERGGGGTDCLRRQLRSCLRGRGRCWRCGRRSRTAWRAVVERESGGQQAEKAIEYSSAAKWGQASRLGDQALGGGTSGLQRSDKCLSSVHGSFQGQARAVERVGESESWLVVRRLAEILQRILLLAPTHRSALARRSKARSHGYACSGASCSGTGRRCGRGRKPHGSYAPPARNRLYRHEGCRILHRRRCALLNDVIRRKASVLTVRVRQARYSRPRRVRPCPPPTRSCSSQTAQQGPPHPQMALDRSLFSKRASPACPSSFPSGRPTRTSTSC